MKRNKNQLDVMKRILISGVLLITSCTCSCAVRPSVPESQTNDITAPVQEESLSDMLLHSIESEYEKESKNDTNTTTVGMIDLAYRYADKWDAVAVEYYDKILAVSQEKFEDKTEAITQKLDQLKASYDAYAENNMDVTTEIYHLRYSGGSIVGPLCATKYYELKKEYALELVGIYEKLTFDME